MGSLWIPPLKSQTTGIQLDPSLLVELQWSPPSPLGKAEDTAPTQGWTDRSHMDTQVEQTHRPAQAQEHTGHSTKEHTYTIDKTTGLGTQTKCRCWGPCIDRARITWGGGP